MTNHDQDHTSEEAVELISSAKIDRLETILGEKVSELVNLVNQMKSQTKALSLEAEELKAIRESFKKEVYRAVQNGLLALADRLSAHLTVKLKKSFDIEFESLGRLNDNINKTIDVFKGLSWKMLGFFIVASAIVGVASCTACFYLVPGKHKQQELTEKQTKLITYGRVLANNFEKLTPHSQKILNDGFSVLASK